MIKTFEEMQTYYRQKNYKFDLSKFWSLYHDKGIDLEAKADEWQRTEFKKKPSVNNFQKHDHDLPDLERFAKFGITGYTLKHPEEWTDENFPNERHKAALMEFLEKHGRGNGIDQTGI